MIKVFIVCWFYVQSEDTTLISPCMQEVSTIMVHRVGRADSVCTPGELGK